MSLPRLGVQLREVMAVSDRAVPVGHLSSVNLAGVYSFGRGLFRRGPLDPQETSYKSYNRLIAGEFVISQPKAWEGALALVTPEFDGWYLSPVFPTFSIDRSRLLPEYLSWFCRRSSVWFDLQQRSRGIGARRETVSPESFLSLEIPLPSVVEQHRIVARIEAIAGKVEEARRLRGEAAQEADALHHSAVARSLTSSRGIEVVTLPDAVQDVRRGVEIPSAPNDQAAKWQVPSGWRRISVAELLLCGALLDVKDGNHGANHPRSSEFLTEGVPFLMASDIQGGLVAWGSASRLGPATVSRLRVGFAREDDVLFTHKASIGKTAIADRACVLSPQVTYYRCNAKHIEPRWLQAFLGSAAFLSQLADIQAQSTRDFVSISKQYQQFVLLPPLEEQHRIVAEIEDMNDTLQGVRNLRVQSSAQLDALLPAVLDKAFRGEM